MVQASKQHLAAATFTQSVVDHYTNEPNTTAMHLMYTLDAQGKRIYTLKKIAADNEITKSAHPARFSPDDKYSRQRVTLKKRYNLLPN
ncbi:unnamed protein product [Kluyveromyces dobzhanskii CBS 2104]|uniref:H/ACA ribonucleoprotein complex subunit NOP10 n=1 Tax=Kluyveromyces dobzhanskii CBS 2104 TaxID=1427455 RepID=A0A0A8L2P2_9SACH|nr:unnamed protein product [Kluyveromyces dobzhanskii CBS 2104]